MHPIDQILLRLVLLPKWFFKKQGVDLMHLKVLLDAKLTMDNRIPASLTPNNKKKKKSGKNLSMSRLLSNLFLGLMLSFTLSFGEDALIKFVLYFSSYMLIMSMMLITDFSGVLLDTKDNVILLPKPITEKTLLLVRTLHITVRVLRIALPMLIPGLISVVFRIGVSLFVPFLFEALLLTLFCVFLVNTLYFIMFKFFDLEKFKSVLMVIQISFAVLMMGISQLLPRFIQSGYLNKIHLTDLWWMQLLPPYWFADATLFLSFQPLNDTSWLSLALSVLIPLLLLWLVLHFFGPSFQSTLLQLSVGSSEKSTRLKKSKRWTYYWQQTLSKTLNRKGLEQSGFDFTWRMMSRSRDYKLKVLPQFGLVIVIPILLFIQKIDLSSISILFLYFSGFVMTTALSQLPISEKNKGAWLYSVAPIGQPGPFLSGAFKAVMAMYYLPLIVLFIGFWLTLIGLNNLPSLFLGLINQITIASFFAYLNMKTMPFSQPVQIAAGKSLFVKTMLVFLPQVLIGILHFTMAKNGLFVFIFMAISIALLYLMVHQLKNRGWNRVRL